jgi:GlpG protein
MRMVGETANREQAQQFTDYLLTLGIGSAIKESGAACTIWVYDEELVNRAEVEFRGFSRQPEDGKYKVAPQPADSQVEIGAPRAARPLREIAMPRTWTQAWSPGEIPVSLVLIAISVAISVFSRVGEDKAFLQPLFLTRAFQDGELWRLVTPIFVHYGYAHILFNMLWLKQLGGMVEVLKGHVLFLVLVMVIAVPSNYAQYLVTGPGFGGMSGVVYGLFGYIWVKSRREPWSGFYMEKNTVYMMIVWFVLCTTGLVGNVANWAHGVGLGAGLLLGLIPGKSPRA